MPDPFSKLSAYVFVMASFSGLAALLRSGQEITKRALISALLNSGFIGLTVFYFLCRDFHDNIEKLIAMSLLAGVGGASIIDFIVQFVRGKLDINVSITKKRD